jgi:hypothetical protein
MDVIRVEKLELYNNQEKTRELTDKEVIRAKFRLLELLGQAHNIIIYIRELLGYIAAFKALAKRLILIDN